jgi:hypothetical protein
MAGRVGIGTVASGRVLSGRRGLVSFGGARWGMAGMETCGEARQRSVWCGRLGALRSGGVRLG